MSEWYKMRNFTSSYFITKPVCTEPWKGPHSHWFVVMINCGLALTGWRWCVRRFRHAGPEDHFSTSLCPEPAVPLRFIAWLESEGQRMKYCSLLLCFASTSSHHGGTNVAYELNHSLRRSFFLFFYFSSPGFLFKSLPSPTPAGDRLGALLPPWHGRAKQESAGWFVGLCFLKAQAHVTPGVLTELPPHLEVEMAHLGTCGQVRSPRCAAAVVTGLQTQGHLFLQSQGPLSLYSDHRGSRQWRG